MKRITKMMAVACGIAALGILPVFGAGTLAPSGSGYQPIRIENHDVQVTINNGFARTQVTQTFYNPNAADLEAVYSFPLPKSASLSEVTILVGEKEIHGEVVAKDKAKKVYEEEKNKGNEAGLASKNGIQDFRFNVSRVLANDHAVIQFVYYQPLQIDTGVGRYVYPLEEGGTDDQAESFWTRNDKVEGHVTIDVELKSSWPIADVRAPGYESSAVTGQDENGNWTAQLDLKQARLNGDFVFYYRLQDNLPGRVELMAYRENHDRPGTFMLIVTPGMDLQPLTGGSDYMFVLDVSGSMSGKIQTLCNGVAKALGQLNPNDRFRVVTFNQRAHEVTPGWVDATEANVTRWIREMGALQAKGSTNVFDGLKLALCGLDADRATSVILVTDGVTNTGIVSPKAFHKLMSSYDVRVFGFLLGNSANWPLMRTICNASGGFYTGVSNQDDIIGQILLAKSKVTHECLHNASLKIRGVRTYDTTDSMIGKVYRGQQLVFFGRYSESGEATVTLDASLTGEDHTYTTTFEFPEIDTDHPELERLWALHTIETVEAKRDAGLLPGTEADNAIRDLGVAYQLVTDETSMVVLSDAAFQEHGIERRNQERVAKERQAQARRAAQPVRNHRVDTQRPAFPSHAPSLGGGGALDPIMVVGMIILSAGALVGNATRRQDEEHAAEK